MFNGTLEVGKEYELNNGEVWECVSQVKATGIFGIGNYWYREDGRITGGIPNHFLSVRGPAVGTPEELELRPGDVVGMVSVEKYKNHTYTIQPDGRVLDNDSSGNYHGYAFESSSNCNTRFRLISRAADTTDTPTLFRDMTDAEVGALYRAIRNGKTIQMYTADARWVDCVEFSPFDDIAYRIKPEPTTETRTLYMGADLKNALKYGSDNDAYKLHFDVIDGKPCNPRFEAMNEA